ERQERKGKPELGTSKSGWLTEALLRKASSGKFLAFFASLAVRCLGSRRSEVARYDHLLPEKFTIRVRFVCRWGNHETAGGLSAD
ncbi:MAG: hypothetical protein L0387_09125, partial [Acidobacteria bacterium]|nr:hypothetical protein [Acidobacteriota bacterium]